MCLRFPIAPYLHLTLALCFFLSLYRAERTRSSDVEEINRLVNGRGRGQPPAAAGGAHNTNALNNPASLAGVPIAELTQRVKDMCRSVDAFVCVVDNRQGVKDSAVSLIHAMMAAANGVFREHCVPLLVLSTVESSTQKNRSCVELADTLKLTLLSQPWRMEDLSLENLTAIQPGLDWLLEQSQA